ncbi:DUF2911 domain-containing protein [Psychroserpens ponticola]|uniref:DUF2911 domain-containing protein n=1 Tax=Psychroserpens ponticola TaxID=2932268 RepID=A0ABY7S3C3_9FLAO|nr:DUF2911 domain-containing protein [Psychroserpens ponticola]WCO02415.1 DUF2911 domain-containing protein [Psychroserpens ponticola]
MKTSTFISTITMAFLMLISFNANAQKFPDLDKSPMDAASFPTNYKDSEKVIKIVYSRPNLKDREVEKLVKKDDIWRVGANEAAELTLYKDLMFGDTVVTAGTYTFYIKSNGNEWTAIISKDLNVWGSYFYKQDNDVARFTTKKTESKEIIEAFSIVFEESKGAINMHLGWGNSRATFPFNLIK